jgi:hypothetical protein
MAALLFKGNEISYKNNTENFLFLCFSKTGVYTQGFTLAMQALLPPEQQLPPILLWLFWRCGLIFTA